MIYGALGRPESWRLSSRSRPASSLPRLKMLDTFRFVFDGQTYGDAAKTKTISRRKSERIARILRGEDRSNGADSSKFRFWVRAKGFRLGAPPSSDLPVGDAADDLYVVTSTIKVSTHRSLFRSRS